MDCSGLRDDLLDVLYGEASAEVRRRVDAHASGCPGCREELSTLRSVRSDLQRWKVPEARPLPFHRAAGPWRMPFLATAAALVLLSVAALGLGGSELRYQDGRLSFRLGRAAAAAAPQDLSLLAARHEQEIAGLRAELAALRSTGGGGEEDGLTQRFAQMLRESEARQTQRLQTGLSGLADRAEARRRYDLARIGAGLAYIDGKNGQQFSRTAELMGHVLEASQKRTER